MPTRRPVSALLVLLSLLPILGGCLALAGEPSAGDLPFDEPLFDWRAILHDPLEVKTLSRAEEEGIVYEEFEYTAEQYKGQAVRIYGILAYPRDGKNLPGVFWSQSGMYAATRYWPGEFARKGYLGMNITLPHEVYDSFAPWNAADPKAGNLTHLAHVQMRAITYLTQRPEVDAQRIGISGSSYGGFFATLLAGADPRIKAGSSFFAGGNQHLGTIRPQFTQLAGLRDMEVWLRTIDPAWRLRHKAVPFLWAAAGNDNWDFLPALRQTYLENRGDARLAILPGWEHALPENVDRQLLDWFDVHLKGDRRPYNRVSPLAAVVREGRLTVEFAWTGQNPVASAQVVYSPGPWITFGTWVHRLQQPLPAQTRDGRAWAEIPVPDPRLPLVLWGTIVDDRGVVISTAPEVVIPAALGVKEPTGKPVMVGCPYGDFEPESMVLMTRHGWPHGQVDGEQFHGGKQSIRVDPPQDAAAPRPTLTLKQFNVPGRPHRLQVFLRSRIRTSVNLSLQATPPASWHMPLIQMLEPLAGEYTLRGGAASPYTVVQKQVQVGTDWSEAILDLPAPALSVEGYNLLVQQQDQAPTPLWIDDLTFTPLWD